MKTKIPGQATEAAQGWVFYDGECPFCTKAAMRFQNLLHRNGFALAVLQAPWVRARFSFVPDTTPDEMIVLLPDDRAFGGADGIVQIARRIWWAWPLFALAQIPGAMFFFRAIYRWIAANRHCLSGSCDSKNKPATRGK